MTLTPVRFLASIISSPLTAIQNNGYQCSRLKFPNVFKRHLLTISPHVSCRATTHGCSLFGCRTMADVGGG